MANPRLTPDQLDLARTLLDEVRARLVNLSSGDKELLCLPPQGLQGADARRAQQADGPAALEAAQDEGAARALPALQELLPERGAVLDRARAINGYTLQNTRLIHDACDVAHQSAKRYT